MEAHHAHATRDQSGFGTNAVSETRKLAAILVADIVGYSRLAGADEKQILARLLAFRSGMRIEFASALISRSAPCKTIHCSHRPVRAAATQRCGPNYRREGSQRWTT